MIAHGRLVLLILEGYFYLAFILAVFLSAVVFLAWGLLTLRPFVVIVAILVAVPVAATAFRALRALWLVFPAPDGIEVGPAFGARLHHTVQDLARRVRAPRVHRIVVTGVHNASALQLSSGWLPTNTLALGYPLLATLSVDQMQAVIAHELAHLTYAHGRFSRWVYRTRLRWMRLLHVLEQHQSVPAHVYFLFRFYVPRLNRYAAEISRQHELLADRLAADVAGADVAAQALVAIEIGGSVLEEKFWPGIFRRVAHDPEPPNPFAAMGPDVWREVDNRQQLLDRLLNHATGGSDTHPALRDRLAAIGRSPQWPDTPASSAADHFFGVEKERLLGALAREWRSSRLPWWSERHAEIRARRDRLAVLAALPSPSPEELHERGVLTEEDGHDTAALELYLSAHRQGHAAASVAAGALLLEREDESGIALIEQGMAADASLIEAGCSAVADFLEGRGRHADAHPYRVRQARLEANSRLAKKERAELSASDRFRPPAGPGIDVAALVRGLRGRPGVVRAFLVGKHLRYADETQTLLVVLAKRVAGLDDELKSVVPDGVSVMIVPAQNAPLESALREVPDGLIYDSGAPRKDSD